MKLDAIAVKNLEIVKNNAEGKKYGSLLWVLDKTKTAMGKRMLRSFIERPLYDCAEISKRLNSVDELYGNTELRERETELMIGVYDMERLMTRIVYNTANAKELLSLCTTLENLPELKENLKNSSILIVAQRVGTIIDADKIIVLDKGEIVGTGTHTELVQSCQVYKDIVASQLSEEEATK